jgi:hypothetical protein
MSEQLVTYADFEGIMNQLAIERDWEFKFADELISVESVFNHAMYAPALLAMARMELEARSVPCDLGLQLEGESQSLFGAKVRFDASDPNPILAQIWRLAGTSIAIEMLPRDGRYIVLDPLQYVLGDSYAAYVMAADREIQ